MGIARKDRYFEGKRYFRYDIASTKGEAKRVAERQRGEGYNARIVTVKKAFGRGNAYEVYLRKAKS